MLDNHTQLGFISFDEMATRSPGIVFAGPHCLPAAQVGIGRGAHAPDEFFVIQSNNPKSRRPDGRDHGIRGFLYEIARDH